MTITEFETAQWTLWHAHEHLGDHCMASDAHIVLCCAENELRREMASRMKAKEYQEA